MVINLIQCGKERSHSFAYKELQVSKPQPLDRNANSKSVYFQIRKLSKKIVHFFLNMYLKNKTCKIKFKMKFSISIISIVERYPSTDSNN